MVLDVGADVTLERVTIAMASVSLLSCIVITVHFLVHAKLRTFCFKLVWMLVLSQCFLSLATIIGHVKSWVLCALQAAMRSFFQSALILWSVAIALTMYLIVTRQRMGVQRYFRRFAVAVSVCLCVVSCASMCRMHKRPTRRF